MSNANADKFKATVQQIERDRNPAALVALFAEDATLDSPPRDKEVKGKAGATEFWSEYLDAFDKVQSTFRHTHAHGDCVVLEWESTGELPKAAGPIKYRGVSVIHFSGDKVKRFVTYYDSAAFLPEGSKHTK